jgi:rhodanese-related sulfurtransferase
MCPMTRYPMLQPLLSPFRRSQQKTLALVIAAMAEVAQAASIAVAGHLAVQLGIHMGSALTRFYRLLRNERIEDQLLTTQLLRVIHPERKPLLLAIDWTEWHHELRRLVAAVVVGCRAIPVQVAAFSRTHIPRSQNLRETTFLRLLVHTLRPVEQTAVVLCDRGFRRVRWLAHLQELRQAFVVRLVPDVIVITGSGGGRLLRAWHLQPGQAQDLGMVHLRQDRAVPVRVVGVWAPGHREPWWLATDLTAPLVEIVALYDRRITIEEQFRDTKGCRFGVRLEWTQFHTPQYLARLLLLVGVVLVLWTAVGHAVAEQMPSVRLHCNRKGPRLSLVHVGMRYLLPLAYHAVLNAGFIQVHLPAPALRRFAWLQAAETTS